MDTWLHNLVENNVQCLSCPIFDKLFQIISEAAASVYPEFVKICVILFCVLLAFYIFNAVWSNMASGFKTSWLDESFRKIIINSLVALSFLGMGVMVPRFVTQITFEPVATMTLYYTQSITGEISEQADSHFDYEPIQLNPETGLFRPELRDTIIQISRTTITQFQSFMHLGIAIMDKAFSWSAFSSLDAPIKHIILFVAGLFIFWSCFKLFLRFLFYFTDVIVSMMFFAFFFPLSLATIVFRTTPKDGPEWTKWMGKLGTTMGSEQIKSLINAIVTLGSVVIVYNIIGLIIGTFFLENGMDINQMMSVIQNPEINVFDYDLSSDNMEAITLIGCIVLWYIINVIAENIPTISKEIMAVFELKPEKNSLGEELGESVMKQAQGIFNGAKDKTKKIIDIIKNKDSSTPAEKPSK